MVTANNLEYFKKVEGGYFLPEENKQDLLDFINSLNNRIVELENAIKKEREKSDEVISSKNDRIKNLEEQLETIKKTKSMLQNIIDNKDKIIKLKDEQIKLLENKIELYKTQNSINEQIIKQKDGIISAKDEIMKIEKRESFKEKIDWALYGFIIGVLAGIYVSN